MIAIAAIAAASAIAQYYQAEEARGANAERLRQLEADFNRLIPPQYNVKVMDPPNYIKQAIPNPSLDMSAITPEEFKLIGKYTPEVASYVAEQNPKLIEESALGRESRAAQLDALRQLKRVASNDGVDPEMGAMLAKASRQSQIDAQSRQQSILQDMARRGTMGSGAALAAQMQGSSDAMDRAAQASRQAAVESYRNRLAALKDSASLAGQIRGDEMQVEGKNVDIINDFNRRTAANRQNWENDRVSTLNNAQLKNIDAAQQIADRNVSTRNQARFSERDRRDALQKYLYDLKLRERDYQNNIMDNEAKWRRAERDNQNTLARNRFDDQYRLVAGRNGLGQMAMQQNTQNAQDRNGLYQGLANAAIGAYSSYSDKQDRMADRQDARDRAYFERYGTWPGEEDQKTSSVYGSDKYNIG